MAHMLKDLVDYFKIDEINIDNWTFKLYYKVTPNTDYIISPISHAKLDSSFLVCYHVSDSDISCLQDSEIAVLISSFQVSVVICMAGATIGIASQYFGDPIR